MRGREATHGPSGLIVRFHPAPDDPAASDGEAVNSGEVYDALIARHGIKEAVRMLARLMREAGDAYRERS